MPNSVTYNRDCLEYMRTLPDDYFDLAVADPPYGDALGNDSAVTHTHTHAGAGGTCQDDKPGINLSERPKWNRFGQRFDRYKYPTPDRPPAQQQTASRERERERESGRGSPDWRDVGGEVRKKIIAWDVAPEKAFFDELFRVSRNQVIWGGNYFELPPTRCFLIWRKLTISEQFTMAMAEYAWTSFNSNAKVFECAPQGRPGDDRFHPCLPAGTKVYFDGKWQPVESIKPGAKNQFGTVTDTSAHDAEKMVVISAGDRTVTSTWNHPFLVKRENSLYWINAEQVKEGDELLSLWKQDMLLQKRDICGTELTAKDSGWSIALFGKKTMARFLTGCRFITRTLTKPITTFPIYSLSRPLNTSGYTKVADLSTAFGISRANAAASSNRSQKKTGIFGKRTDGFNLPFASRVTSRKLSKTAVCVSQTVGNVKIINEKTRVYNLTLSGIPAFETEIGITHNTQKPIALYRWIYGLYTEPGMKVFDPMMGSQSSRLAAWDAGLDYTGCEIDPIYFEKGEERFERYTAQISLFE